MADLETIQEEMRERLREIEPLIEALRVESQQIKNMLEIVDRAAVEPTQRPPRTARRKAPRDGNTPAPGNRGRPRGSGKRAHDALERIASQPGVTAAELAQAMGIKPNYLYRVLPALEKEGKITKQGKGYHPSKGEASPVP